MTTTYDATMKTAQLQCRRCGKALKVHSGDVGKYTRDGWPECCGQQMRFAATGKAYFVDAGREVEFG